MPQTASIDPVVAENLKAVMREKGRTAYSVAQAIGVSSNWLYRIINMDRGIQIPTLRKVAEELGVSIGELVSPSNDDGKGLTDDPTPAASRTSVEHNADHAVTAHGYTSPTEVEHAYKAARAIAETKAGYNPDEANDQDGIWNLPIREVRPAAGSGEAVFGEEVVGYVPFRRDWLRRHRIDPEQADVVTVSGDSMVPTLPDGCQIIVDRHLRELRSGCIYVMRTEEGLVVKRVKRNAQGWWLLSDNPAWAPLFLTEETDIIGEVRWAGRTF